MYSANKQYLESQGRPSSFLGQIGDIPNRIHEATDAGEIGMKMMRHSQLTDGGGLPATGIIEGIWQVGQRSQCSSTRRTPTDMAIDWIRTGQLGPPPPGSTPGPGEPGARPG